MPLLAVRVSPLQWKRKMRRAVMRKLSLGHLSLEASAAKHSKSKQFLEVWTKKIISSIRLLKPRKKVRQSLHWL
jgi:hypothetical protein